jgi:hypothetical protein
MPRAGESIEEWTNDQDVNASISLQNHTDSQRQMIHMVHFPDMDLLNVQNPNRKWKNVLLEILPCESETFTISDVYERCEELLSELYPNNNHIRASIKHNLQRLRDDGFIEFLDNKGRYQWI